MIQSTDRRIFSLPSVRPCEFIPPATLLNSLIALCDDIAAAERFPIHRRIVREAVREASILSAFFRDLQNRRTAALLGPTSLSFSELHVILQQLRHLLHDCARGGARLWLLTMSDRVNSEFIHLFRCIAAALDVLPLPSLDVDAEVKELVRMLGRQAWEVAIGNDPSDERAIRALHSILSQFENGVPPSPAGLKLVLSHLQISSWSQCDDEVLFLEEELLAGKDEADCESRIISSLIGFMVYSRATLFDTIDVERGGGGGRRRRSQNPTLGRLNLKDLQCPISLELMTDPVTISTGHTYDRLSIQRWLKAGNLSCPVSGEMVTSKEMVPNCAIKRLIIEFCHQNNIPIREQSKRRPDMTKAQSPGSSAAAGAIRMLAGVLVDQLSTGMTEDKNRAAYEIRLLSKSSLFNRAELVGAGSVPWLLHLFYSADPSTQENSVGALLNLSKLSDGRTAIHDAGGLALIIDVIREGIKSEAQQNAAAIMFYLSSIDAYRQEIGEIPEAIPSLVELLRRGTHRGKKNAVLTLIGIQLYAGNHSKILAANAIPSLADLLITERGDLADDCALVLANLAERLEGANAILQSPVVHQLVEFLSSSTSQTGKEHCISALLHLCIKCGEKALKLLEEKPLLMPSLYSLVTGGSPQARKYARSLLNRIHRLRDQDSSAILAAQVHIHAQ